MYTNKSDHSSSLDRAVAIFLTAFSMFAIGYTASRVVLSQSVSVTSGESIVVPHQAAMWSDLGR